MKPQLIFSGFIFLAQFTMAAQFGQAILGGAGCSSVTGDRNIRPIKGSVDRYLVPLMMNISKASDRAVERRNCSFRLPIIPSSNEKVIISKIAQKVKMSAGASTKIDFALRSSVVGGSESTLRANVEGKGSTSRSTQLLNEDSIVAESNCGEAMMFALDSQAVLTGKSAAKINSGAVALTIQIVSCR
jgi:hypothetical protein